MAHAPYMKVRRIGIVGYDGVEAIDIAGPADVFAIANQLLERTTPAYEIVLLAEKRGPIQSESGVAFWDCFTCGEADPDGSREVLVEALRACRSGGSVVARGARKERR